MPISANGEVVPRFLVADSISEEREEVSEAVAIAGAVGTGVIAVGSVLAVLLSGRILAPIREMSETAQAISDSDLARRIDDVEGQDEARMDARGDGLDPNRRRPRAVDAGDHEPRPQRGRAHR